MNSDQQRFKDATDLLELLAKSAGHLIDRQKVERSLFESHLNESQKQHEDWMDTIASCGEALEFRIRRIESTLDQVISLVRSGISVAAIVECGDGEERWVLISKVHRRRLLIEVSDAPKRRPTWVSIKSVLGTLGLIAPSDLTSWLVCYPVLMHEASATDHGHDGHHGEHGQGHGHGHGHHSMSPVRRLIGILKPETNDLWVIAIFSIVVGLLTLTTPIAVEALVNTVAFGQYIQPVVVLALMVFVFLSFSSAMTALQTYVAEIIQRRLFVRLVDDLAFRIPRAEQDQLDRNNPAELANRFLEVVTIQKVVAKLLLDGLALILQTAVGMLVLAFYHPFLLGYDIVLLALIAFTLFVMGRGAINTAINESINKYQVLNWLQEIGRNSTAFKLNDGREFALSRADHLTMGYLEARRNHFRIVLRQIICSLIIYCLAASSLLGLGGWLVISGELSLGQLVAAELIVLLIVRSFAKLGSYMEDFYDLTAAVDKVGMLIDLQMEQHDRLLELDGEKPIEIEFDHVSLQVEGFKVLDDISFVVPAGRISIFEGSPKYPASYLVDVCMGIRHPTSGLMRYNGVDSREFRLDSIREQIGVARQIQIFRGTLDENIHLNRPQVSLRDVWEVIDIVGLLPTLHRLEAGLQLELETGGFPLTRAESMRLMIARALVGKHRLVILDCSLDTLAPQDCDDLLDKLESLYEQMTILIVTQRSDLADYLAKSRERVDLIGLGKPEKV